MGRQWKQCQTLFWGAPKSLQMVTAAMKLKDAYSLEGKLAVQLTILNLKKFLNDNCKIYLGISLKLLREVWVKFSFR